MIEWGENNSDYSYGFTMLNNHNIALDTEGEFGSKPLLKIFSENADFKVSNPTASLSINKLRNLFAFQHFFERDARGGTRYNEQLLAHYGVAPRDDRLQRSQYLGGGKSYIEFNSVPQTSSTDSHSPQGNVAAYGVQKAENIGFKSSFEEHGFVIGLASVVTDQKYQYGLDKMFSRRSRFDYYFPDFAHLGEQAILQKEIFATGKETEDNAVFGYQERFGEYRYGRNLVTGELRSSYPQSLDYWHTGQKYTTAPKLNSDFIESNPPISRSLAVKTEPQIVSDMYFDIKHTRVMPVYSTPGLDKL